MEVDYHSGEMGDKEYERNQWSKDDLCPAKDEVVFKPCLVGTGYIHNAGCR